MSRLRVKPFVYDLNKGNSFVTKVSTNTMDENPKVVFLRAKVVISPFDKKKTYEDDILSIRSEFDSFARNLLDSNPFYDKDYIFSVDVAEKSVKYKKDTHLRYDIFLKPKTLVPLSKHRDILEDISDELDCKLIELFNLYRIGYKDGKKS